MDYGCSLGHGVSVMVELPGNTGKARFLKGILMESFEHVSVQYTPMIHKIISSLNIFMNKDEYFQVGLIGLWEAYQKFDPEKGGFTGYAYSTIKGSIMMEMSSVNRYAERESPVSDDWEFMEDVYVPLLMEEDILLSYCQNAKLTDNQTKWVICTFLQELTVAEIAEIEQVSLGAVKKWRAGAKEKLRNIYSLL